MLFDVIKPIEMQKQMTHTLNLIVFLLEETTEKNLTHSELQSSITRYKSSLADNIELGILTSHSSRLINRILEFQQVIETFEARKEFVQAMKNDVEFNEKQNDVDYKFSTFDYIFCETNPKTNSSKKKSIKSIFGDFYDAFFSVQLDKDDDNTKYRELFLKEYEKLNVRHICPACLGTMTLRTAEIDHYFPKSKFPVLSIHPLNLVPLCHECNTSIGTEEKKGKGEKVPTCPDDDSLANEPGLLDKIYLPYSNSAVDRIFARVEGEIDTKKFVPILENSTDDEEVKLNNHSKLFNLHHNWTDKIDIIHNNIMSDATDHYLMVIRKCSETGRQVNIEEIITLDSLAEYLNEKHINKYRSKISIRIYQILYTSFAIWLLDSPLKLKAFLRQLKSNVNIYL